MVPCLLPVVIIGLDLLEGDLGDLDLLVLLYKTLFAFLASSANCCARSNMDRSFSGSRGPIYFRCSSSPNNSWLLLSAL